MNNFLFRPPIFGQEFGIDRFNINFQTTSDVYVDALSFTIPAANAGRYVMFWSYRANNSNSGTSNQTEARFNNLALVTNSVDGKEDKLGGGKGEQFSGFAEFTVLNSDIKISLAIRRSLGNGTARINSMNIMAFRVE